MYRLSDGAPLTPLLADVLPASSDSAQLQVEAGLDFGFVDCTDGAVCATSRGTVLLADDSHHRILELRIESSNSESLESESIGSDIGEAVLAASSNRAGSVAGVSESSESDTVLPVAAPRLAARLVRVIGEEVLPCITSMDADDVNIVVLDRVTMSRWQLSRLSHPTLDQGGVYVFCATTGALLAALAHNSLNAPSRQLPWARVGFSASGVIKLASPLAGCGRLIHVQVDHGTGTDRVVRNSLVAGPSEGPSHGSTSARLPSRITVASLDGSTDRQLHVCQALSDTDSGSSTASLNQSRRNMRSTDIHPAFSSSLTYAIPTRSRAVPFVGVNEDAVVCVWDDGVLDVVQDLWSDPENCFIAGFGHRDNGSESCSSDSDGGWAESGIVVVQGLSPDRFFGRPPRNATPQLAVSVMRSRELRATWVTAAVVFQRML